MSRNPRGAFVGPLLDWYEENGRHDLPWREEGRSPFQLLVAEVLLQRTGASAVAGAYAPLVARYPTPESIVAAPTGNVEELIAPLGLLKRADYLERLSGQLLAHHDGRVPRSRAELLGLHGVGEYTARSVLIHVHGEALSAVDTNVDRLVSRFFGLGDDSPAVEEVADGIAPPERSGAFLHAMLDFAAAVCTARSPNCDACPIRKGCASVRTSDPE